MGERERADLALIKERQAEIRRMIERGAPTVPINSSFTSQQLGLRPVWADDHGHLWRDDGDRLTLIPVVPRHPLAFR